jgi:monoamine oxidase
VPAPLLSTIEFDPGLPEAQRIAARQLEYARISKSAALFRKRFWGEERFSLVGGAASDSYFHSTLGQSGVEGILCGYAVGAKSDALGALDSRRRLELITHDLLPVSDAAPVLARDIISYDWHCDRYAGGAYALYQPGQWFTLRPALQAPHGRVLFAGEHLAECQGFMEGAVVSGQDAAETLRAEG